MEQIFTNIYETNQWGSNGSTEYNGSSGWGSDVEFNKFYITELKNFITDNNITNITDLGCGDFKCGKIIYDDLINITYTGYDAYKKVIDYNSTQYPLSKYSFIHLDFYNNKEDIKRGELCILKDVVQHWPLVNIYHFLDYLVECKKFKYIVICNCGFQSQNDTDIVAGDFRPLSSEYFPLKKYSPTKLYNYNTKEVSVIELKQAI